MPTNPTAAWFPRTVGSVLLLVAFLTGNFTGADTSLLLPGFVVSGGPGRALNAVQIVAIGWLAWGCFARRRFVPNALFVCIAYVLIALWIWLAWFAEPGQGSLQGLLVVTAFLSAAMLAFARALWQRRAAFGR